MNEPSQNVTNEGDEIDLDAIPPNKGLKFTVGFLGFCIVGMIVLIIAKLIAGDAQKVDDTSAEDTAASNTVATPNTAAAQSIVLEGGRMSVEVPVGMTFQRSDISGTMVQIVFEGENGRIHIAIVDISKKDSDALWIEIVPSPKPSD